MMKKVVSLLLILCLVLGISCTALADVPSFTTQPVDSTTDKGGNLSLIFKGEGFVPNDSSWHFIEPDTGKEWTGPQLREEMKARKVHNFTLTASEGKQKLYLTGVPKFMHGWEVYVLLVGDGGSVESNHIHVYWYGMDPNTKYDAAAAAAAKQQTSTQPAAKNGKNTQTKADAAAPAPAEVPEEPAGPKIITVTADKVTMYPVDSRGNAIEDQAAETLTFEDIGSVAVRSDEPVKYWTVNGIRIEPDGDNVTSFVLKNITSDLVISAKVQKASSAAASSAEINPDSPCEVTCTGCTFTYHKGGLKSATSGTVPAGATIIVFTSDAQAAQRGYSINGDSPEHQGSTSFRLKIEEDTTISVP